MSDLDTLKAEAENLMAELWADINALRDPSGHKIQIPTRPNENSYRYFLGPKTKTMYCWTVHPDTNGNYWSFEYKPFGRGSRSGKATRYKATGMTRASRRKIAKGRALARFHREQQP